MCDLCFLSFGEIMLRLRTNGYERFFQSPAFEATFGGGEANVAVSLCNYGLDAGFISALPDNDIGQSAINSLRALGVDTSNVQRQGDRVGIYYLETGANQRASKVIYDRAASSICEAKVGEREMAPHHRYYPGLVTRLCRPLYGMCERSAESRPDCLL